MDPLRFVLILCRTKPYTINGTSKKGKWLTSSLFQRITDFFLHLIKWGIKVNCYFLQNRAGVPLKSCGCGTARTKVIAVFFLSLSLILHSHISSCCKNEISPSNFIVAIVIMDRSEGSTGKLLLSGHLWDLPLCPVTEKFVKIAQCLLTINIQRLLCAVIKFHPCCWERGAQRWFPPKYIFPPH